MLFHFLSGDKLHFRTAPDKIEHTSFVYPIIVSPSELFNGNQTHWTSVLSIVHLRSMYRNESSHPYLMIKEAHGKQINFTLFLYVWSVSAAPSLLSHLFTLNEMVANVYGFVEHNQDGWLPTTARHSLTQLTRNHVRETKRGKKMKCLRWVFTRRHNLHVSFGSSFSFRGRFHLLSDEYSMCHFATMYTSWILYRIYKLLSTSRRCVRRNVCERIVSVCCLVRGEKK